MSNFPYSIDDDVSLPIVFDNLTEIGGEAINALRDAVFNIETEIGVLASGSAGSVANRISASLNPDGTVKPSAIASLGLVTLPIYNQHVAETAGIVESKIRLDHRTHDLFNYITDVSADAHQALGWISVTGSKLDPHLLGAFYRHTLDQIDVPTSTTTVIRDKYGNLRNTSDFFALIDNLNTEILGHELADSSPYGGNLSITTHGGSTYTSNYGHVASGIYVAPQRFSYVPQTVTDLQTFAEYIDSTSILVYGGRVQNLYSNGISRSSRSTALVTNSAGLLVDGYGQNIIPATSVIAYLRKYNDTSYPYDDINQGDDIVEFLPSTADMSSFSFDEKFASVKVGDILRINYNGTGFATFVIKEKKYNNSGSPSKYIVRIDGKNLDYSVDGYARIDRPLVNNSKYGVLSVAQANNSVYPSLIIGSPRGAQALGNGFNPDVFDSDHYALYLVLYPTGNPVDGYTILPPIDVTGDAGTHPGTYTLDSIVRATNAAFRSTGHNYRFIAFSYKGEFGIMLADSYNNAAFSIVSAIVNGSGFYDQTATGIKFTKNVVDVFVRTDINGTPIDGYTARDPLGFGPYNANIASPIFLTSYGSSAAATVPTNIFVPLKKNNFYVNGIEIERLTKDIYQSEDFYGDGYWTASVFAQNVVPGVGVQTTYRINSDLSASGLAIGKTIVVQPHPGVGYNTGTLVDCGRFIISDIGFGCSPSLYTDITVYDAIHASTSSPPSTSYLGVDGVVVIYFNSDSVSFNRENSTDWGWGTDPVPSFKRHFEVYINESAETFTHERGRACISGTSPVTVNNSSLYTDADLRSINILKISPKLRGYQFGSITKLTLRINNYSYIDGVYDGYLCKYDGIHCTNLGPSISGKKGSVTRFYDETQIDYIDIIFEVDDLPASFVKKNIDIQLFPTLSLDDEVELLATCQLDSSSNTIDYLRDERQFGNTSEKDLSDSALEMLSLGDRLLHSSSVIRGFDLATDKNNPYNGQIYLSGGLALVNGSFIQMNNETVFIPLLKEFYNYNLYDINWIVCVNSKGEYQTIPLLDYDNIEFPLVPPSPATPNAPSRVFQVYNVNTSAFYYIEATTFSDLVNNRKDLAPLYIVRAAVTLPAGLTPGTITLITNDVRKYVNDADSVLPLRLTTANAQGNFRSLGSIFNWLKYNSTFNNIAIIRGSSGDNGTINDDAILDFSNDVVIDGQNNCFLTTNGKITLGSNLTVKDLTITLNGGVDISSNIHDLTLYNCVININISGPNSVLLNFVNASNIEITHCTFNIIYSGSTSTSGGAVFKIENTDDFYFNDNSVNVTFNALPGSCIPGDVFILKNSTNTTIEESDFSGNFSQFLRNTNSSYMTLYNLTVTSTYNPHVTGYAPDSFAAYSTDNLPALTYSDFEYVNTGRGWIYANVTDTLQEIHINNVTFNYNPAQTDPRRVNRLTFINFELSSIYSKLTDLNIENCRFNHLNVGGDDEDLRAAIAIINKATGGSSAASQPALLRAHIVNNICNRNQSIIMTSVLGSNGKMAYPGLMAQNCVIRDNICGTIGYWISSGTKYLNTPGYVNTSTDKMAGLDINNNLCHYIHNCSSDGYYFLTSRIDGSGSTANQCYYPSGDVVIRNNQVNWIHVAIAYEENSSLKILNNILNGYDTTYITKFKDSVSGYNIVKDHTPTNYGPAWGSWGYAIFVNSNMYTASPTGTPKESNDSSCIITANTTGRGYWMQGSSQVIYPYEYGDIFVQSSATITDNILKGTQSSHSTGVMLILLGGISSIVTNNKIYRQGFNINSYISFDSCDHPLSWDGSGSRGLIVDNFFDSYLCSTGNENLFTFSGDMTAAKRWVVERNINQTGYATIPITDSKMFYKANPTDNWVNMVTAATTSSRLSFLTPPTSDGIYKSLVLKIQVLADSSAPARFFSWQENIDKFLPINVRVIKAEIRSKQLGGGGNGNLDPGSSLKFSIMYYRTAENCLDLSWLSSSSSNDTNFVSALSVTHTGSDMNTYTEVPFKIDMDSYSVSDQDNFITGKNYPIAVNMTMTLTVGADLAYEIYLTPVSIKYRW